MDELVVIPHPQCFEMGLAAGIGLTVGITAVVSLLFFHLVTIQWPPSSGRTDGGAGPELEPPALEGEPHGVCGCRGAQHCNACFDAPGRCRLCDDGNTPVEHNGYRWHLYATGEEPEPCGHDAVQLPAQDARFYRARPQLPEKT